MSRKFLVPIDLNKNELQNVRVHVLASAPASPVTGQIYYNSGDNKLYFYNGSSWVDTSGTGGASYQPLDDDLTAIAALTGNGLLRKTGGVWAMDSNTYLTGNQTITLSGDATGSGSTAITVTLANSGVTAGTYNNNGAEVRPFTVDAKGRVTAIGAAVGIAAPWAGITGKPTTLGGYGITDAVASNLLGANNGVATLDGTGKVPASQLPAYVDDVLEFANLAAFPGTGSNGVIYIAIDTSKVYRWTGSVYAEISPTAGNADTATKLLTARSISITGDITWTSSFDGSANVTAAGTLANSGATAGSYGGSSTQVTTFTVDAKGRITSAPTPVTITPAWGSITGKPTTRDGYGITDVPRKYAAAIAGGATSEVITHNLGTRDCTVQVIRASTPWDTVECDVEMTSTNTITLRFATAPAAGEYRVVVVG